MITGQLAEVVETLHKKRENLFPTGKIPSRFRLHDEIIWTRLKTVLLSIRILRHLEREWPEGLRYNTWYAIGTAQRSGLLDDEFRPTDGSPPPCRMSELLSLGGSKAVQAYGETMGEDP